MLTKTHFWDSSYVILLKVLIKLLKRHSKIVSKAYLSNQSLDKGQMLHDVQPGDEHLAIMI